jgi:hypothetical protein
MKELSLNILDITKNSVTAGAKNIAIRLITDSHGLLTLTIEDDGCGMTPETVRSVTDPFCTSRKTRKVGLGLPFLTLAANQAGGDVTVTSRHKDAYPDDHGTVVKATFDTSSIDFTPVGDVTGTIVTLINGSPDIDFEFEDTTPKGTVRLSTKELREVLGGVSLAEYEVLQWIEGYLEEQYSAR